MIWVSSEDGSGGINQFNGKIWTHFNLRVGRHDDVNTSLIETRDGTLWLAGQSALSAYKNHRWTTYKYSEAAIPRAVTIHLLQSSDDALWIAGVGVGAVRLDLSQKRWTAYDELDFGASTPDGSLWFIRRDSTNNNRSIVHYDKQTWREYSQEDGLMSDPNSIISTTRHGIWAAGAQNGISATAQFDGTAWHLQKHPHAPYIYRGAVYESNDGSLWFGPQFVDKNQRGGILQYQNGKWIHHTPQMGAPRAYVYGIGQTSDNILWAGTAGSLYNFDGQKWSQVTDPEVFIGAKLSRIHATPEGDMWVCTRWYGVYHYQNGIWTQHDIRSGLADNRAQYAYQTQDGTVWISTLKGISRFDGQSWTTQALPKEFTDRISQTPDGALWISPSSSNRQLIRYVPDDQPPQTQITQFSDTVSQPGNTIFTWKGADPWRDTPDGDLQFSYRLNNEEWSPYSNDTYKTFLTLSSGDHTFEVKARDRDFNEDSSPAVVHFTVIPPVYQQAWFLALMAVLLSGITFQTIRVIRRDRRLQESNSALSDANKELFQVNVGFQQKTEDLEVANQELQRDRAVERIRAQVQAMEKAEDFDGVLSILAEDLHTVDLTFTTCGIDVLDDPEDAPTMPHFESNGFRYTAYTIDPEGTVASGAYHIQAPFPPVVLETIERFIEGQPWQALTEGKNAILEVPISRYGRLRLTASDRERFTNDEIATLQDFAAAIALGYARYSDFQVIQEQTERKSRFLSAISHELRTPLTAIKGFADNLLEGISGDLTERQERGVSRIGNNSVHMLNLVNDLLDIARIEAGRVEINPEQFDIHDLIIGCCDTVAPLAKPGVQLTQDIDDNIGGANTDQGRVRQIIINLLSNALKFTEQGEVKVRARIQETGDRRQEAGESELGQMLEISVSDTGTGIPEEDLATIFEEFK